MPAQRKRRASELETTAELGTETLTVRDRTEGNGLRRLRKKVREESQTERAPKRKRPTTGAKGKSKAIATATGAGADTQPYTVLDGTGSGSSPMVVQAESQSANAHVEEVERPQRKRAPPQRKRPTARATDKAKPIATTTGADSGVLTQPHTMLDEIGSASVPTVVEAGPQSVNTPGGGEYRAARWRKNPPIAVSERIQRCMVQRMFVIGREPVEGSDPPEEKFMMAGTTGNIYTIHINNRPNCEYSSFSCHLGLY